MLLEGSRLCCRVRNVYFPQYCVAVICQNDACRQSSGLAITSLTASLPLDSVRCSHVQYLRWHLATS